MTAGAKVERDTSLGKAKHITRGYSDKPCKTNIADKFLVLEGGGGIRQEPRDRE